MTSRRSVKSKRLVDLVLTHAEADGLKRAITANYPSCRVTVKRLRKSVYRWAVYAGSSCRLRYSGSGSK